MNVVINSSGAGGSIEYREGDNVVGFGWEFAMPPTIALIFGPSALAWKHQAPWAADHRAEIFDNVGREVVRQRAPQGEFVADLERGIIEIYSRKR
ncbi:MAG TPA: hypothetical protein VGN07_03055 [Steroidobacteraceae bacterium]|jgi:hypothetical protein